MARGTFANIRIRNLLAGGTEGGVTRHLPDGELMPIYDAAMKYKAEGVPLVVLAGTEYGTGSSRDWAAKGPYLLGVRAVIAAELRADPSQQPGGHGHPAAATAGGPIVGVAGPHRRGGFRHPRPGRFDPARLRADGPRARRRRHGHEFPAKVRIDTPVELEYYRNGGILQTVLRKLAKRPGRRVARLLSL